MASNPYLGYVGGVAVAVGVGAAIAAAAQGSAHADTGKAESTSASNTSDAGATGQAGPKKATKSEANGTGRSARPKPVAKVTGATTSAVKSDVTKAVSEIPHVRLPSVKKPTPAQFEAEQVARLEGLFAKPRAAASTGGSATQASTTTAAAVTPTPGPSIQSADPAPDPNPFRADDPWPTTMPAAVLSAEKALLAGIPAPLQAIAPFVREAYEAIYRGTQIVPYVNVVVPVSKILPALVQAAQGDRTGAQVTINQLLLTTGPISLLYYGFDQLADLLNIEDSADTARQALYTTLWDSLDPTGLLHVPGQSGL